MPVDRRFDRFDQARSTEVSARRGGASTAGEARVVRCFFLICAQREYLIYSGILGVFGLEAQLKIAISFLDAQLRLHEAVAIDDVAGRDFIGYHSIRKIPAYKGQGHLPGFYWFSGINQLVPYESRLEMFTLMGFDFDGGVIGVLAQPLMLHFERGGQAFRHVPDFLVWHAGGWCHGGGREARGAGWREPQPAGFREHGGRLPAPRLGLRGAH